MTEANTPGPEGEIPVPDPRCRPERHNIVLVGFMATGKTSFGRLVARRSGFSFVDMDREIEDRAGVSIAEIFSREGESGFRNRETDLLESLLSRDRCVISTGGGVVVQEGNRELLRRLGFVVWLHAKKKKIFERVQRNPHRPLLQTADPFATLSALADLRKPLYKSVADLKVKTGKLHSSEVVSGILESAAWFFAQHFPEITPPLIPSSPGGVAGDAP